MTAPLRARRKLERPMTAVDLFVKLRERYPENAWALFAEVGNATGTYYTGCADAVAMSLWPSRGLAIHGFEIKVSRADLLRELKSPEKSAPIQKYCDHWWLVLAAADLIAPGELPPTWGVLAVRGGRLQQVTEAPKLDASPIDRKFLASLFRRVQKVSVPRAQYSELESTIEDRATKLALERADEHARDANAKLAGELTSAKSDLSRLQTALERFEKQSGLKIEDWRAGDMGEAVALLLEHGALGKRTWSLRGAREASQRLAEASKAVREAVEAVAAGLGVGEG